ncbi:MAG: hypothetical protein FWE86_04640 [Oscillospiraceae bacterium]|nr:hypothetical protein [Oscillospiraceae bacterium]
MRKEIKLPKNRKHRPLPANSPKVIGMPTPAAWGGTARPSSRKGAFRLEGGDITLEHIPVRLFPDKPKRLSPIPDPVIGSLPPDEQRPILPLYEEDEPDYASGRSPDSEREISEFESWRDAETIRDALIERVKGRTFGLFISGVAAAFLLFVETVGLFVEEVPDMFSPERGPAAYIALNLILCLFCVGFTRDLFLSGFRGIRENKFTGSALFSVAAGFGLLHMLGLLITTSLVTHAPTTRVLGAPLAMAVFINTLGSFMLELRLSRGFNFVSARKTRHAVMRVPVEPENRDLLKWRGQRKRAVAYTAKTKFLEDYMRYALEEDWCEHTMNRLSPFVPIAATVIGLVSGLASGSLQTALFCFAAAALVGTPVCRTLCVNAPVGRAANRLLKRGVMLNGWAAVDEFSVIDSLAVSADMLFPGGTVEITAVKSLGETPIERAMLMGGSLILAAGGPVARVFSEILANRSDTPTVASTEYENEMGVAGFVDSVSVLVGNRHMLDRHLCDVPSRAFESRLIESPRDRVLYIAIGGHLCAAISVRYTADDDVIDGIRRLLGWGVTLMVCTADPNITSEMLGELFGVPASTVAVMPPQAGKVYDELTHVVRSECPAVMASSGRLSPLAEALGECVKLRGLARFSLALQLALFGIGLALTALVACVGGDSALTPARLVFFQAFCLATALFPTIL